MTRQKVMVVIFLILIAPTYPLPAQDSQERPKIGLALSGGGARGGAHVGVLKALEELNIPIDYIAGTSMGAIVGGFYATGYSAAEIEQIMADMNWTAAFSDQPDRRDQTMRKKLLDAEFLIPHRLGFNHGKIQLPLGMIEGQHLDQILQRILLPAQGVTNFNRLPIPYRAVATDLVTGQEVILSRGSLSDAIRASMSVPGVFAPVRWKGRLLVDGGMANNLPISVVREMGADVVIAVDISSPLLEEKQLKSILNVTEQLTNFLTRNNTERQIALLGPDDFLFVPDLKGFSSANFEEAGDLIDIGYTTIMSGQQELAVLSGHQNAVPAPARDAGKEPDEFIVTFIEIDNRSALNDEIIRSHLPIAIGEPLDLAALDRMVDQIYGLDVFQSVTYSLARNDEGRTGLVISALPRTWGPNYLQFGLEFSDDFSGSSEYKLGAAYTRNALNSLGGELRVIASIGRENELSFDFYQPIDKLARWFVEPQLFLRREQYNVWEGDQKLAILDIAGEGFRFGIGRNLDTTNLVQLNYESFHGDSDLIAGTLDFLLNDKVDIGELQFEFRHDSLDNLWFPTSGSLHRLGYRYAAESLGAAFDYQQAVAAGGIAFSSGKNTFMLNYELGYSVDDLAPVERWFELGGFGRLSGLIPDQLSGRQMGLFSLAYQRRLNNFDILPAFAGLTLEAGNVWMYEDDVSLGDLRKSGSVYLGAETPLGPIYLAWGYSDNGDSTVYFYLGNPFRRNRF